MNSPLAWAKNNKFSAFLLLLVIYFGYKYLFGAIVVPLSFRTARGPVNYGAVSNMALPSVSMGVSSPSYKGYSEGSVESVSPSVSTERKVATENYGSYVVKDVQDAAEQVKQKTVALGGFEVSTYISKPEESASANLVVRVPSEKIEEFLDFAKNLSVKVVSINKQGRDVTDQYTDLDSRLTVLEESYTRIEQIYDAAIDVDEMLRVQQQLFSLRDQIDSIKGQKKYLDDITKTSKFTLYLSTDEFSLPYSPEGKWRPEVTYKYAVRSLVQNLRGTGNMLIWLAVYSVILIPLALILFLLYRTFRKRAPLQ